MRTTMDIDEDVLQVAKDAARQAGTSIGRVISDLVRKALEPKAATETRNGVMLFTSNGNAPGADVASVNRLRDED